MNSTTTDTNAAAIHEDPWAGAPTIHSDPEPAFAAVPEQAVGDADQGFTFRGIALHEFTVSRRALFAEHRLRMGAPSLARTVNDVDGFQADAWRILWLCSHDEETWQQLRCSALALQGVIDEWADSQPCDPVEVVFLGMRLLAAGLPSRVF